MNPHTVQQVVSAFFDMSLAQVKSWLATRTANHHRQLLVISGTRHFCTSSAQALVANQDDGTVWLGESEPDSSATPIGQYARLLGSECNIAIYDSFAGLQANAALALAGIVKRGGIMILLCPELSQWPSAIDPAQLRLTSHGITPKQSLFRQMLIDAMRADKRVALWSEHHLWLPQTPKICVADLPSAPFATSEQAQCYTQLVKHFAISHAPVILTSDRGRGKSVLLGLIAAHLAKLGFNVALTSQHKRSVENVFSGFCLATGLAMASEPNVIEIEDKGSLHWLALDNPALTPTQYDFLFIDEAASTPLPVLTKLLKRFAANVVLSSTVRGYEGSGRGFLTRTMPELIADYPSSLRITLYQPIRWYKDDPLEAFWYGACLLDGPSTPLRFDTKDNLERLTIAPLSFQSSSRNDLQQVIDLLMLAHYQTTPDDIIRLLDAPDQRCFCAYLDDVIVGVALINIEGGTALSDVAMGVANGSRRVRGHLAAQSISLTIGNSELACMNYWRIVRIAVQPELQQQGIGSLLVKHVLESASSSRVDCLTTSFGITDELVKFWRHLDFMPIKVGQKPDNASGEISGLFVVPLSDQFERHLGCLVAICCESLQIAATNSLPPSFSESVKRAWHYTGKVEVPALLHKKLLAQVADGTRSPLHVRPSLAWLYKTDATLTTHQYRLFNRLAEGSDELPMVAKALGYTGKKAVLADCVEQIKLLLNKHNRT